jgi:hypothetical protein
VCKASIAAVVLAVGIVSLVQEGTNAMVALPAGLRMGVVIAATVAPTSPSIDVCWYWSNSSQTRGYWDFCQ